MFSEAQPGREILIQAVLTMFAGVGRAHGQGWLPRGTVSPDSPQPLGQKPLKVSMTATT